MQEWRREGGKNLRGTTAVSFSAYQADKIGGREAGQEQARNENGTDDSFRSIQCEVAGDPHEGQQRGDNRLEGDLQQLDDGDDGGSGAEGDQLCADRNPLIAEQGRSPGAFSSTGNIRDCQAKRKRGLGTLDKMGTAALAVPMESPPSHLCSPRLLFRWPKFPPTIADDCPESGTTG